MSESAFTYYDFVTYEEMKENKDELLFKTRGVSQWNQAPSNSSSSIYKILQEIVNSKGLHVKEADLLSDQQRSYDDNSSASNDIIVPIPENVNNVYKMSLSSDKNEVKE